MTQSTTHVTRRTRPLAVFVTLGILAAATGHLAFARHLNEQQVKALEAVCEKAREARIAPLREQAIKECIAMPRSDPAACRERHRDFGEARRADSGRLLPRMFHDLPECVQAHEARQHFGLNPP